MDFPELKADGDIINLVSDKISFIKFVLITSLDIWTPHLGYILFSETFNKILSENSRNSDLLITPIILSIS